MWEVVQHHCWVNSNWNHNEIPLHLHEHGASTNKNKTETINIGKDVGQEELLFPAGMYINWQNHFGKLFDSTY